MDNFWFGQNLNKIINDSVMGCHPKNWDEDFITSTLLKNLGEFFNKNNSYTDSISGKTSINFRAYKYTGKQESSYGDIAFYINIRYDNGANFKGIGLLEAKKRLVDTYEYRHSGKNQFTRILKNAPYANLILYDFEPLIQFVDSKIIVNEYPDEYIRPIGFKSFSPSHCVTCPLYLVKDDKIILRKVTRSCSPLADQLLKRYFHGLDLHTEINTISSLEKFEEQAFPKFVAIIEVTHGDAEISINSFNPPENNYDIIR